MLVTVVTLLLHLLQELNEELKSMETRIVECAQRGQELQKARTQNAQQKDLVLAKATSDLVSTI